MAQTIKINGVTYDAVNEVKVPLASNPDQVAVFSDTSDANAAATDIKDGQTAYVNGTKVEGTMPVNPAVNETIDTKDKVVTVPPGYTPGGNVKISDTEKQKIKAENIRAGISILGVNGSMSSTEGLKPQSKTVTPTKSAQVVQPDSGYNALSQVTVEAIPSQYITTTDANAAAGDIKNGKTAYVGGKKVTGTHTDPSITLANGILTIA